MWQLIQSKADHLTATFTVPINFLEVDSNSIVYTITVDSNPIGI